MTLEEYKKRLYYGCIDIDSEAQCYELTREGRSDIEMIKLLVETASSYDDYVGVVIDDYDQM